MSAPATTKQKTNNSNNNNEADIIFNRANVALARSQRLVASWLPPVADDEKSKDETESEKAELQKLEDEIFTPVPERLGLGAPIPKQGAADKLWGKTELSADDKLRKTLLGRNFKKIQEQKQAAVTTAVAKNRVGANAIGGSVSSNSNTHNNKTNGEDDDEEDEGRSALGKSKKVKKPSSVNKESEDDGLPGTNEEDEDGDTLPVEQPAPKKTKTAAASKRKGAGSFLDDLLSDRKKKKKK